MKRKNMLSIVGLLLALLLVISGCGNDETQANQQSSSENEIEIGFSFGQSVHPFFIAMEKGARDAAEELGVNLRVTSADYKLANQIKDVENLIQTDVDAVLLNPIDSKAVSNVVKSATDKDVPVFTVDIDVVGAESTSFIASDNTKIGKIAAEYIIDQLDGNGKVALIGWPTITSTMAREKGFLEVIENAEGIELVANQGAGMERSAALKAAENILQANPDVDAFFGVNESAAMGALGAVQGRGNKEIFIVGVDATPDLLSSIKNETQITATVAQDPYKMGKIAVEEAVKYINGESVDSNIPVETDLVTIENVEKYIEREAAYKK